MEFDYCAKNADITNFEYAKRLYRKYGYELPRVVFWNVQSRNNQQPVKSNEQGVALVSGFTSRIFSQVMSGEMDPYTNMMNVIGSERYEKIKAA
jgi:acyl-CoA hydrolase